MKKDTVKKVYAKKPKPPINQERVNRLKAKADKGRCEKCGNPAAQIRMKKAKRCSRCNR